jgi:predicted nucleic acid-binding protein
MGGVLYLDTSAVLRAVLEHGMSPEVEQAIGAAQYLITSRLSLIESARALLRLRDHDVTESRLADAQREVDSVWARCTIWEMTPTICNLAAEVAPRRNLRTLDAIHLATFLHARRRIGAEVALLTSDRRLAEAAGL